MNNINLTIIGLIVFLILWLYFGLCGLFRLWRVSRRPQNTTEWVIAVIVSPLFILGPLFMQAAYEAEIKYLKECIEKFTETEADNE